MPGMNSFFIMPFPRSCRTITASTALAVVISFMYFSDLLFENDFEKSEMEVGSPNKLVGHSSNSTFHPTIVKVRAGESETKEVDRSVPNEFVAQS